MRAQARRVRSARGADESEKISSGIKGSIGGWGVKSPTAGEIPLAPGSV
ncbi:hypothetical protein PLANPX_4662 [Lacipirellula parvula]|uniref:Uncharacterized protein n=1 Tax=Lacipirellula parvula TaxID=2650471 RepID=A0A5K7XE42_9BACT|nr:hypothetical protein PLANPX_4662 [Lacipirellula parvula]